MNMKITGSNTLGAMAQAGKTKPAVSAQKSATTNGFEASFDKISLSSHGKLEGDSRTHQEVASKISHEVRTHNTTGKIAQLREEVENGTYKMDARETASRMLLMGAVE